MRSFEQIGRESAIDACERALRARVLGGDLPAGARLPPERDLAMQLGVDRGTLRPAIARLTAQGLLEARQGRGTTVLDVKSAGSFDVVRDLLAAADSTPALVPLVKDLLRVRRHLARALLEVAVDVGPFDDDDLVAVVDAADAFATAWGAHGDGAIRGNDDACAAVCAADLAVMKAVVHAVCARAGSVVFALAMNPVERAVMASSSLRAALAPGLADSVVGWQALIALLRAPSADHLALLGAHLDASDAATVARLRGRLQPTTDTEDQT